MKGLVYLRMVLATLLLVLVGVVYFMLIELLDREVIPRLFDQGSYVFAAKDATDAMARWNFYSYLGSVVISGLFCAMALVLLLGRVHWVTTLPAVATATLLYGMTATSVYYRIHSLTYDVIEAMVLAVVLPLWFVLLGKFLKKVKPDATT